MKAITLHQPWASLLACGEKHFETRSWETKYRGKIAIHAAIKPPYPLITPNMDKCEGAFFDYLKSFNKPITYGLLPLGCIIATAELVECWEIGEVYGNPALIGKNVYITDEELIFGDFTPGRYAWEFANMKMLDEPIPAKGRQRLWEWEG